MTESAVKILIIESEAVQRYGLAVALSKPDRTIFEVGNPAEALGILQKNEVDVVFTEIRFPAEDGMEALIRLIRIVDPRQVVVISAALNEALCVRLHELGIRLIIEKPVDETQIETIHEIVTLSKEEVQ